MFQADLSLYSKRVLTPEGLQEATLQLGAGKILAVLPGPPPAIPNLIDLGNKVLMPGVIDPHVHINEPGRTEWEGFDTATRAAIAGGVTTVVDMPLNASPVTTTASAFDEKVAATASKLHTHTGFWGGIVPGNEHEIEPLIENGVLGFKAFLTHSGIDEFPNVTESDLRKAMPLIARSGLPLLVHCELDSGWPAPNPDPRSYRNYLASRPHEWEDRAIALMIRLCEECNCRVHIVHLSSASSIPQIRAAKEKGLPLTVETAQHYLYFAAEDIPDGNTAFKCAPPIRDKENREQLWQALREGIIDFVATDHSPAPPEMKEKESGDLMKSWGGIASLQLALPVLWTAAQQRGFTLQDIGRWLCSGPAEFLGSQVRKGKLEEGFDADLVVWDPEQAFTVSPQLIRHRHQDTPYLGERLLGVVEQTWLMGTKVFENGNDLHLNRGQLVRNGMLSE